MRIIPVENKKRTAPITIEFAGHEVEQLLGLVGAMDMQDFNKLVQHPESFSIHKFGVTADQLDGLTDNLFELIADHIEGRK